MNPMDFVRAQAPFDGLPPEALERAEKNLEIAFFPKQVKVLSQGGTKSTHLYLIRKGEAHLARDNEAVAHLDEGDFFGYPSLLSGESPAFDVVVEQDLLVYRWPDTVFKRLLEYPVFSDFFTRGLAERLRKTVQKPNTHTIGVGLNLEVGRLVTRPPVYILPEATVEVAARLMQFNNVSSVLVSGEPLGILTDRDLRNRVLAAGLGPNIPVSNVMSAPAETLEASVPLFEALSFMVERGFHHLPIKKNGALIGVVTDTSFLRQQTQSPLFLAKKLSSAQSVVDLEGYTQDITSLVSNLVAGGLNPIEVGRSISTLNDQLSRSILKLAEAALGPPPCAFAWIAFGSEGRMEQALPTDQDNALVFADDSKEARDYFAQLASFAVGTLIQAGFPSCLGGFMATNWCKSLSKWESLFEHWIENPTPKDLLEAQIFFDFRKVGGSLSLEPLEQRIQKSAENRIFLSQLAKASLQFRPPLGFFRQIREDESGVDLKKGGIAPIVSMARVYALEASSSAKSTLERLEAAVKANALSEDRAEVLQESFSFLMGLRLRSQLKALSGGAPLSNTVRLQQLSSVERRHLKEAFGVIREQQETVHLRYQTDRLG